MKKKLTIILSLVLAMALCLGIFAACAKGLSTDQLDKLYKEFQRDHRDDATETAVSYYVGGKVSYLEDGGNEISANIKWTIEGTTLVTVGETPNAMGQYQIIVPEKSAEAISYKLVGTMVDENGNPYQNAEGNPYKLELSKSVPSYAERGDTYKLVIKQLTNATVIYAKAGAAATYYVDSSESADGGADFFTETVEGGKKIYTLVNGVKAYLGAKISGGHNNIVLGGIVNDTNAAAYEGSVWTISENEIKTVVDSKTLYLGTYGDKTTFSVSEYKTYPAFLVVKGTEVKPQVEVSVSEQSENCTVTFTSHTADSNNKLVVDVGAVVKFTVAPAKDYEIVSVKNGVEVLTVADGVYTVTASKGVSIVVETKLIGSNGAQSPVTGEIKDKAIPVGWTYVPSDPVKYPNPDFYGTSGKQGLKVNFVNMGILSPELDSATGYIMVKLNIYALNASQTSKSDNGDAIFKVEGLDAEGNVIVTGNIGTFTVDDNNVVTLDAREKTVKSIRVILVEKPAVGGFAQNVNLGGVTIIWGSEVEPPVVDNSVASIGSQGYDTLAEAIEAVKANEEIKLKKDITVEESISISKAVKINLNKHNLTVANQPSNANSIDMFIVGNNGNLTIIGEGNVRNEHSLGYIVYTEGTGIVTIEGGNYYAVDSSIVQVKGTAKAYIKGGKFEVKGEDEYGSRFVLNKKDADKANTVIEVTGGSFVNFDPANSTSENPAAAVSFVAEGYESTTKTEDGKTVYEVAAKVPANLIAITPDTLNPTYGTTAKAVTINGVAMEYIRMSKASSGSIQFSKTSSSNPNAAIYNTTALAGKVTGIALKFNGKTYNNTDVIKVEFATSADFANAKEVLVSTVANTATINVSIPTDGEYTFVRITNVSADYNYYLDAIEITIDVPAEA